MTVEAMRNKKARCVRQAIMAAQHVFDDGGGFKDAFQKMKTSLHDRRMEALSFKPDWQHIVAFSAVGMLAMVGYEGIRAYVNTHSGHMPSLLNVLKSAPFISASIEETKLSPPVLSPSAHSPVLEDQPKTPPLDHHQEYGPDQWGKNFDANFPQNSQE